MDQPAPLPDESKFKREQYSGQPGGQRMSVVAQPGREGHVVGKGEQSGKAIAVFTSGGDAQGM